MAKRMRYMRIEKRRFSFKYGQTFLAIGERQSLEALPLLPWFVVPLDMEQTLDDVQRRVRTEVLKRIEKGNKPCQEQAQ
jgi:hypothetical protein